MPCEIHLEANPADYPGNLLRVSSRLLLKVFHQQTMYNFFSSFYQNFTICRVSFDWNSIEYFRWCSQSIDIHNDLFCTALLNKLRPCLLSGNTKQVVFNTHRLGKPVKMIICSMCSSIRCFVNSWGIFPSRPQHYIDAVYNERAFSTCSTYNCVTVEGFRKWIHHGFMRELFIIRYQILLPSSFWRYVWISSKHTLDLSFPITSPVKRRVFVDVILEAIDCDPKTHYYNRA